LVPNGDDVMFLMIGQMNSDEFGVNREAFLAVPSSFGALEGNYAVVLYVDDDAAIASGREVWGWPKKAARFDIAEADGVVTATAARGGVEVIRVSLEVAEMSPPGDLRLNPTWFNLKLIPSIVPGAPPDVMQITSTTLENVGVSDLRAGEASVAFASSLSDPLGDLIEVRQVLGGMHFLLDCDLMLGEVVHDYLLGAEAALAPQVVA
jgi:acetoacetate decarboxylase